MEGKLVGKRVHWKLNCEVCEHRVGSLGPHGEHGAFIKVTANATLSDGERDSYEKILCRNCFDEFLFTSVADKFLAWMEEKQIKANK